MNQISHFTSLNFPFFRIKAISLSLKFVIFHKFSKSNRIFIFKKLNCFKWNSIDKSFEVKSSLPIYIFYFFFKTLKYRRFALDRKIPAWFEFIQNCIASEPLNQNSWLIIWRMVIYAYYDNIIIIKQLTKSEISQKCHNSYFLKYDKSEWSLIDDQIFLKKFWWSNVWTISRQKVHGFD